MDFPGPPSSRRVYTGAVYGNISMPYTSLYGCRIREYIDAVYGSIRHPYKVGAVIGACVFRRRIYPGNMLFGAGVKITTFSDCRFEGFVVPLQCD